MNIHVMKGFWRYMIKIPPSLWQKEVSKHARKAKVKLAFMSDDHRRVHHWVVKELPTAGKPLSPKTISDLCLRSVGKKRAIFGVQPRNFKGLSGWSVKSSRHTY